MIPELTSNGGLVRPETRDRNTQQREADKRAQTWQDEWNAYPSILGGMHEESVW